MTQTLEIRYLMNLITDNQLSPNQFYLLSCMKDSISPVHINIHQEIRDLLHKEYIVKKDDEYILSAKSHSIIDQIESIFKKNKKKTTIGVMGKDYEENIQKYLEIFPKMKLPSGKAARSDKKNVEVAFKWFFENYSYTWDIILLAAGTYVDDYEKRNYMYMQTSQYFIRKQNGDKTWASELANMCAVVESGDSFQTDNHFSEKVV